MSHREILGSAQHFGSAKTVNICGQEFNDRSAA